MQSKRGELVPVAEVVSRLGGPVAAIRDASPQALHHFSRFDQVNQLVGASEAAPLSVSWRGRWRCAPCPAPTPATASVQARQRPVQVHHESATGDHKLPFGTLPRLILAWVSTEAVRTQSREISF